MGHVPDLLRVSSLHRQLASPPAAKGEQWPLEHIFELDRVCVRLATASVTLNGETYLLHGSADAVNHQGV